MGTTSVAGTTSAPVRLSVEIWSDVVCPWCYIGKRRFERAAAELAGEVELDVVYRPYQLDPRATPGTSAPVREAYARKFGGEEQAARIIDHVTNVAAGEGLGFRMDRALRANTLLAHRLLWRAERDHGPALQRDLKERLLRAYFADGLDVGDPDVLATCAGEVGMDAAAARRFLDGDEGVDEVRQLLDHAAQHDITAVPTYVIADPAGRAAWMIPGAQDSDTFVAVIRRMRDRVAAADAEGAAASAVATATATATSHDAACEDDACAVAEPSSGGG